MNTTNPTTRRGRPVAIAAVAAAIAIVAVTLIIRHNNDPAHQTEAALNTLGGFPGAANETTTATATGITRQWTGTGSARGIPDEVTRWANQAGTPTPDGTSSPTCPELATQGSAREPQRQSCAYTITVNNKTIAITVEFTYPDTTPTLGDTTTTTAYRPGDIRPPGYTITATAPITP